MGWVVGDSGVIMAVGCLVICIQPVIRKQNSTSRDLTFIFNPFNCDDGDIEIPELIQETTKSGLVGEGAYQKGFAILLGDDGQVAQPISEVAI
jgi:hypothetical protein